MLTVLRHRNVALLAGGSFVSRLGDWLLIIALPFYVYQVTHSVLATGTVSLVQIVPSVILGPIAGSFVDRWDRRRTMLAADLGRAIFLLPILAFHSTQDLPILYLAALGQSVLGSFFGPAKGALIPDLSQKTDLTATNSLLGIAGELAMLVGAPIGGAVFALLGLRSVVLLDAGSFLFSALLIAQIRVRSTASPRGPRARPLALDGFAAIAKLKVVRGVLVSEAVAMTGQGLIVVLWVVYFQSILRGNALEYGSVQTAVGLGSVAGGVLTGWLGRKISPRLAIGGGGIAIGMCLLATFNAPLLLRVPALDTGLFALVLAIQTIQGIPSMFQVVATRTLVQEGVSDAFRGRAFGILGSASSLALLIGTTLASVLGNLLGAVLLLNVAAILYLTSGLVALLALPREVTFVTPDAGQSSLPTS